MKIATKGPKKTITAATTKRIRTIDSSNWIYILPSDGKWAIKKDGAGRAVVKYIDKKQALVRARRMVHMSQTSPHIIVYNSSGEITQVI
jgi:Uncharacterized protein conserved in bacteria (DUF2188)